MKHVQCKLNSQKFAGNHIHFRFAIEEGYGPYILQKQILNKIIQNQPQCSKAGFAYTIWCLHIIKEEKFRKLADKFWQSILNKANNIKVKWTRLSRGGASNFKLWVQFLLICKYSSFFQNCECKCYVLTELSSETVGAIAPTAPTLTQTLHYQCFFYKLTWSDMGLDFCNLKKQTPL